ncbi:CLUMA_CG007851, isoform A [Clunio marinus]|uniref:CLUMA_CG007851, isoform A n=1 Tax=Clunio marinus TaxID=568069 RepID=A0A1J1I1Y4_9DIPT|nr:CLUMA_CG007851, isoform A [Clunio marinus]
MRVLKFLTFSFLLGVTKVSCQIYNKSCFINYMIKHELLERSYQAYSKGGTVDQKCEAHVNSTVNKLRSASNDSCVSEFLKKKYVSETLIKEYLKPQFNQSSQMVKFDDRFKIFQRKAVNITKLICQNKDVFQPDLYQIMRRGRRQKDDKTKEIECLQTYIMNKNKPLSDECSKIINKIKDEFYSQRETELKRVFAKPNDKLVDLKCSGEKAMKKRMFEKIFFFVVLAATKNMNNQQIDALIKKIEGQIGSATRVLYECII